MTDLTGKLIANTYKDILTINSSATNDGIDGTLRRVQDGEGTNSAISLSQNAAVVNGTLGVTGSMSVGGGLAVGSLTIDGLDVSALTAVEISATNITTDVLTAGTLTFQDVSVSTLRAGTVSATNINAGSTLTVGGDPVVTSAVAVSTAAILLAAVSTAIANTSASLQNNINVVSAGLSATNTQTEINATSIAANASAITVNSDAITSINSVIAGGAFASVGTSATLETRIAGVSSTMATSIANVSSTLEARIAGVSTALASTSAALTSNINTVSATLSIANVSIAANSSAIAALQALTYASAGTSATLETRINSVSVLAETKASAATSANLETRIAAVSSTMATSIGNSNSAITALSATLATSIGNSNSAITALSATMATSIANHLPLAGGTLTGALTLNANPTSDLNAATKQYVDNLTASGIHFHEAVRLEQPGVVSATYNNGASGVGATLTNAGTQAILVVDQVTVANDDRILIYEQTDATQNGVYVVTTVGSPSTNWVLTRSTDADSYGSADGTTLDEGSYFFVSEGATGSGESYVCNTVGTITFGTTDITFVQFSSAITYTAGAGININASRVISTSGVPTNAELAAVSATMATSIANSNSAITALSATMATSIGNSNSAITALSATMATSIANSNSAIIALSATLESRIAGVSAIVPTSLTELGITDGSNGQVLQTDGNSVFTFVSVAPGGSGTVTNIKAGSNISMTEAGTTVTETTTSATIAVTASPSFSSAIVTGDLTVDTNTLHVDSTNNRVGIGTTSPATALEVNGDIGIARTAGGYTFRETLGGGERAGIKSNAFNELLFNISGASEAMRIDSSGDVGIGTISPTAALEVESTDALLARFSGGSTTAGTKYIQVVNTSDDTAGLNLIHHSDDTATVGNQANAALRFSSNDTERMRLDTSGNLLIGSTTNVGTGDHKVSISIGGGGRALGLSSTATTTKLLASFINPNGTVGSIRTSGTSTSYVTSSDYRLKANITGITDGIERVKQLRPSRFNFIADANTIVDGFIAHEAASVVPEAVVGEKDAMQNEKYVVTPEVLADDGSVITPAVMATRSVPDPQGIDQSKLVPLLTAALQEAITKIEDLEARVATLEGN
jgi:hypothetical protein